MPIWWTRPSMFLYSFWKDEYEEEGLSAIYNDGLFFSCIDEEEKTVYVEWDEEPTSYTIGHDDQGIYYVLGDMTIRGTSHGIEVTTLEGTVEYAPFFTSELYEIQYKTFELGNDSITFDTDWEETYEDMFFVNDEPADFSGLAVYNHI